MEGRKGKVGEGKVRGRKSKGNELKVEEGMKGERQGMVGKRKGRRGKES